MFINPICLLYKLYPQLNNMLGAHTPEMYDDNYHEALNKIRKYGSNGKLLSNLQEFHDKRYHFALYEIKQTYGTCENTSSNPAEVNHSSVINYLRERSCTDLDQVLKSLLKRQKKFSLRNHQKIIEDVSYMRVQQKRLESKQIQDPNMILASKSLNRPGFEQFLQMYNQHKKYCREVVHDDQTNEDVVHVYLDGDEQYQDFKEFQNDKTPCDCTKYVSYRVQCVHRFVYMQQFHLPDYDIRYHRRTKLTRSSNIGNYTSNHVFQEIIMKNLNITMEKNDTVRKKCLEISDGLEDYTQTNNPTNIITNSNVDNQAISLYTEEQKEKLYENGWVERDEFMNIASRLYEGMKRNRRFGTLMIGQMLKNCDFFDKNESMHNLPDDFKCIEKTFLERIQEQKIVFNDIPTKDIVFARNITAPTAVYNVHYTTKKRYKSSTEIVYSNVKRHKQSRSSIPEFTKASTNTRKPKSCSFCKKTSCRNERNCSVKERYGHIVENASEYISYLKDEAPYRNILTTETSLFIENPCFKQAKHVQLLDVVCKTQIPPTTRPDYQQLLIKITGIDDHGHILPTLENNFVTIHKLSDFMNKIISVKQRYIFEKIYLLMGDRYSCIKRNDNCIVELSQGDMMSQNQSQTSHLPIPSYHNPYTFDFSRYNNWNI